MSRPERFRKGLIDVLDLDDEELQRGQIREDDGTFSHKSRNVPRAMVEEMTRRFIDRGGELMRSSYLDALKTVSELHRDPNVPAAVRFQAAKWIVDKVIGPDPVVIKMEPDNPVMAMYTRLLSDPKNLEVINGTVQPDGDAPMITRGE